MVLSRKELQALAKEHGIKANQSNEVLLSLLHDYLPTEDDPSDDEVPSEVAAVDEADVKLMVDDIVEVLCDESVWKFATIKRVNKKMVKVCVSEDGSLLNAKYSEIRKPISTIVEEEMEMAIDKEEVMNTEDGMEEELTEYQQEQMELAVRESILNYDTTPIDIVDNSALEDAAIKPPILEEVNVLVKTCATPNKLLSKSPKPTWNSSSKPSEPVLNIKRKSFSNTPVKSATRPLNAIVKLNKTQQLRQEALKKRLQKDSTMNNTSTSLAFTTKASCGTPNYKKIHQNQFKNMKAITSIHARDEKLNNKLNNALHTAKTTSVLQPTKNNAQSDAKQNAFKAKPLPKFYKSTSNTQIQKENAAEVRHATKVNMEDRRRLKINATNSIVKDLSSRNGPFTDLINNL